MIQAFEVGDHVLMRKPHACGANEWEITRTGADIKIRCTRCGRLVMLDRLDFIKSAKKNLSRSQGASAQNAPAQSGAAQPVKGAEEQNT